MPSSSTREKAVAAASAAATRAPPVQVVWPWGGSGKAPRYIGFSGCRWLPVGSPVVGSAAAHIWIAVLPGERTRLLIRKVMEIE